MNEGLYIVLYEDSNKSNEEINIEKPKTYQDLKNIIQNKFQRLPDDYKIFFLSNNNDEIEIHNNDEYNEYVLSSDIVLIFIQQAEKKSKQSMLQMVYNKLPKDYQEMLDDKYNCVCEDYIENEKPYLCYNCQKIFHYKCLKDWDNKRKEQDQNFNCPRCRDEVPLDNWKEKKCYEEDMKNVVEMLNKINKYKRIIKISSILNRIKNKIIDKLNKEIIQKNEKIDEYTTNIEKIYKIFKDILSKANEINLVMENKYNDKILNLLYELPENLNMSYLNEISKIMIYQFIKIKLYIKRDMKDSYEVSNIKNENEINNNEIIISYKINKEPYLTIFGNEFVKNNKEKCKIFYQNKFHELNEYLNISNYNNDKNELEIKLTGINNITDMSYMFYNCSSLISISNFDTSNITNISNIFNGCSSLLDLPDISSWNTSKFTDISRAFANCSSLKSFPDISKWDTSHITNMSYLFYNCSSLIFLPPDLSKWNINNVTNISHLFSGCSSLPTLPDISNWNTTNVSHMDYLFEKCSSLTSLPNINNWDTENVINMDNMFLNCNEALSIPNKFNKKKQIRKRTIKF